MDAQLPLPGMGTAPSDNFFFAVLPDPETARRVGRLADRLRREHALPRFALPPERLHVSLLGLGRHPPSSAVIRAAARVAAEVEVPPFTACLDRVTSFDGHRAGDRVVPIVLAGSLGVEGFGRLHDALDGALRARGFVGPRPAYTPHLTLLYDARTIAVHAVEPIRWRVTEFVLLQSHLGRGLPYTVLGRWPLTGAA